MSCVKGVFGHCGGGNGLPHLLNHGIQVWETERLHLLHATVEIFLYTAAARDDTYPDFYQPHIALGMGHYPGAVEGKLQAAAQYLARHRGNHGLLSVFEPQAHLVEPSGGLLQCLIVARLGVLEKLGQVRSREEVRSRIGQHQGTIRRGLFHQVQRVQQMLHKRLVDGISLGPYLQAEHPVV